MSDTPADFYTHPGRYFQVCAKVCGECLFSKQRIVNNRRVAAVIREAIQKDAHFICHKHSMRAVESDGAVSWRQANVCCRAFFDQIGDRVLVIRLAHQLGNIVFVDQDGAPVAPEEATYE